jgi:chromosome segregation ATPase
MMKDELDHYYNLLLDHEKHKYTMLLERTNKLEGVQQQLKETEAETEIFEGKCNEQRETISNLQSDLDKNQETNKRLEKELDDKTGQLELKEKQFKSVVGELKSELEELGIFNRG